MSFIKKNYLWIILSVCLIITLNIAEDIFEQEIMKCDTIAYNIFDVFLRKEVPMQVITEVSLEETDREELAKKPGIVGYMVKSGDDLWTLAKQYMTTEESIRQINHLENGKVKPGDKLIICKEIGM